MNDSLTLYESIAPLERDFQVRLKLNRISVRYRSHWHEHIELLYFLSGECDVLCGGTGYVAKKGDLIVINSKERHSTSCLADGEYICMHLSPQFFSDVEFEDFIFSTHIVGDTFISECFEKMFSQYQTKGAAYDMQIKSIAYALMAHIVSNYRLDNVDKSEEYRHKNRLFGINDIFVYISSSYMNELTTAGLASHFHLTEQYFCRMFKRATGQTPINYINRYRTEKAAVLLKNTDQSITDIALRVGFDDPNYFSRTFKKYMGISPREYRKSI